MLDVLHDKRKALCGKKLQTNLLMKGLMLSPVIGAMLMGIGSGDVSQ